jgi:hypothetical protein
MTRAASSAATSACRHAVLALMLVVAACSAPVSVERVDLRTAYETINRTALSSDTLSDTTRIVLRRSALLDAFRSQPDAVIGALRGQAIAQGMPWIDLFALAEMHYLRGRQTASKPHLLAAALYAYAVLFPGGGNTDRPNPPEFNRSSQQPCGLIEDARQTPRRASSSQGSCAAWC